MLGGGLGPPTLLGPDGKPFMLPVKLPDVGGENGSLPPPRGPLPEDRLLYTELENSLPPTLTGDSGAFLGFIFGFMDSLVQRSHVVVKLTVVATMVR